VCGVAFDDFLEVRQQAGASPQLHVDARPRFFHSLACADQTVKAGERQDNGHEQKTADENR
jgi:hypothetical protein